MSRQLRFASLRLVDALEASAKFRRSFLALSGVITYLLLGQLLDPGFTHYWWYQLFQTTVTLLILATIETVFWPEGGLAWQTHVIVIMTTLADTLGTAGHLYASIDSYDKIVHFWSGAAFAAATFEVFGFLQRRGRMHYSPRTRAVLAVVVSLLLTGLVWETYEFLSDVVFGSGRVNGTWDTAHDLASDSFGALLAVTVLVRRSTESRAAVPAGVRNTVS